MPTSTLLTEFLNLPADALTDQNHVAAYLDCSSGKLERDRWAGTGLPYLKIGRSVRYRKADVLAFVERSRRISTTETE